VSWLRRHHRRLGTVVALAIVGVTFVVVLPRVADYRAVWDVISSLQWEWVLALLGATALNLVTFAPPWMVALPGLRFVQALPFTQASTAVTYVVPGGGLVGMAGSFALLRSWGFTPGPTARAVTLTGVWNQLANLLLPLIAVFLIAMEAEADSVLVTAAFVGAAVFGVVVALLALVLWRADFARAIGDLIAGWTNSLLRRLGRARRVGFSGESFARFRNETVGLLRRRWHALTVATLVGNLTVFVVLLVAVRAVGIGSSQLTWIEVFAAWALGRVLGLIPITPGGLGVVELGLTAALVKFGGPNAQVVAAVLLYRFLTIVPTLVLGGVTMAVWRRLHPDRRHQVSPAVGEPRD
jgi:uncharacterized protein (TIRG00374 family)